MKASAIKCYRCGKLTILRDKHTRIARGICAACSRIGLAKEL